MSHGTSWLALRRAPAEVLGRNWTKLEARRRATGTAGLFNIRDGVRKATDPRDNRDCAVSRGAKLGQAAGFEARRYDEGIGTGLNEMGEGFIVADNDCYLAHIRFRHRLIPILEILVSIPKQCQLHSFVQDGRDVLKQEIEALLPGQSTYDAEQERIGRGIKAEPPLQRELCSPHGTPALLR